MVLITFVGFNKEKQSALLIFIVIGLLALLLFSCGQSKKHKGNELIYVKGNKRIELLFEGGDHFLIIDKPTKANFVTENIDNFNYSIVGAGIKKVRSKDSDYEWEITPPREHLIDGKLKVRMIVEIENEESLNVEFLVNVKKI